jgi:hypothetical protein
MRKLLFVAAMVVLAALFGVLTTSPKAYAANPNLINFQGKVINSDGTNVTNGSYTFRFRLYTSTAPTDAANACSANTCKWEESKSVTVTNGVFQTELGDTTTMIDVSLYTDLYLGVKFNNDAAGEMAPRVHLDSAPYALNSDKLGGIAASGFVQLGATQSGNINIGTGTITSGNVNGQTISNTANFAGTVTIQGSNALTLGTATTSPGSILFSTGGTNTVTFQGPTVNATSSYVLKLPIGAPALSQCLQNDGTTIGQLTFSACGSGDNISVNGTGAADANFLNTTATGTVTSVTWTLTAASTPDDISATIGNASTTTAGAVTTGAQTFAGDKAFQSVANSTTAFAVQNAAGSSLFNVNTIDTNFITNPGFEVNATGWVAAGTTAPTRVTTNEYLGVASGAVGGVTAAGEGFKQVLSTTLANGTYTISWYDRLVSGPAFTDVMAAYSATGGAPVNCTGINSQTVVATGWTRHWCQITVAAASAANFITIRQVALSTARTWNIDAVQVELGATATAYGAGAIAINANITSPLSLKNVEDSTTAFQIENAAGGDLVNADTVNSGLTFSGDTTLTGQRDLRFADSDSSNWVAFQSAAVVASNVTWTLPSADSAGCLKSDGSGTLSFAACGDTNIQSFAATNTYNTPTNALMVIIEAWGGGGGGGGGTGGTLAATRSGGGGGAGGSYNTTTVAASSLGASVPVTIGAAGTAGAGGSLAVGTNGGIGGTTCFSTTTACAGTMYLQAFGGGGGAATGTVGNGGGGGGGTQSAGAVAAAATGAIGGSPLGSAGGNPAILNSGSGGAGGGTSAATAVAGGSSNWGGGGGGASTTAGGAAGGAGGGSNQGGAGGGAGASTAATTFTAQNGGAGGHVPGLSGGGGTAGSGAGGAGGAGAAGVGSGGDGGGGGANRSAAGTVGGVGGAGGVRGGGGGGGGASAFGSGTNVGGAGGLGGAGYLRTWTLRGAGADLAELYCTNDPSLIAGDAVALDPLLKAGVQKTSKPYDSNAIGIISTSPGLVIGNVEEECAKPVLVALAGRVPIGVSLENGPIKVGDSLTASSTPGIAMKATKAGTVIGQAMTNYDGSMPEGYVVAFVQNHQSNGVALNDLIPGLAPESDIPVSQQALEYLVANKDKAIKSTYISEITTDRVTAGLEIISPSIVTDALTTNTIGSSGGGDISFILDSQNKLVVRGKSGAPGFTVDASGNATFGVSLVSLGNIESKGGLSVNGDALFGGKATFVKLAQFESDVNIVGKVTFNKDAGGLASIAKGGTRVNILFDEPYARLPIVGVTLVADQTILPDGRIEDSRLKEQRLLSNGYSYIISNSSAKGFTIVLNKKASENLQFTWNALAIKNPVTALGTVDGDETPVAVIAAEGQ